MTWQLRTCLYDRTGRWIDLTDQISNLRLRSSLPGGLQTIEFSIAETYENTFPWVYDHIGDRICVVDNMISPPVADGTIFEASISAGGNRVTVAGPWQAYMFSEHYNDAATWYGAGTTSEQILDMLTTKCPGINVNQDNVQETFTNNWPWQPVENKYPGDYVPYLASLSDANNAEWYFWIQSAPLIGMIPQPPIAFFREAIYVPGTYQCWRKDMAPGGLNLIPSLRDLGNDIRVLWINSRGVQRQTPSGTDADSQARYGLRERWNFDLGVAMGTAARQYRALLKQKYKNPQQSASFQLNTWAYGLAGEKWPLWRAIADFPTKWVVSDLYPDSSALYAALDYRRTFITLAAEYSYDSNRLTITPDTQSNRADAVLARYRGLK